MPLLSAAASALPEVHHRREGDTRLDHLAGTICSYKLLLLLLLLLLPFCCCLCVT
jgi:hypothetical protein